MKVAVLMGGLSKEREISLRSGKAISQALKKKGHDVMDVDVKGFEDIVKLKGVSPDAAYIALHGKFGEDGTVQGMLEWFEIPYTGPSVLSSALCFDKILTKKLLAKEGIVTPVYSVFETGGDLVSWSASLKLRYPLIVKPNREGSSIGLTKLDGEGDLKGAIELALQSDSKILVEEFVSGKEITVGIDEEGAFPVVEIIPKSGLYDYQSKYTVGATEYKIPAPIGLGPTRRVLEDSQKIYSLLRCSAAVRVDYILGSDGEIYFLEINTSPGMTETSLLPKAAAAAGVSFEDLCDRILKSASLKKG